MATQSQQTRFSIQHVYNDERLHGQCCQATGKETDR